VWTKKSVSPEIMQRRSTRANHHLIEIKLCRPPPAKHNHILRRLGSNIRIPIAIPANPRIKPHRNHVWG
jgi:hypothetical protein